jgi:hypothetical protein
MHQAGAFVKAGRDFSSRWSHTLAPLDTASGPVRVGQIEAELIAEQQTLARGVRSGSDCV